MKKQKTTNVRTLRGKLFGFFVLLMVMGVAFGLAPNAAQAQTAPPADTEIENQANATYTDNNGNPRTAESNTVTTVVQQVAAVAITDGITKNVSPGGQVTFQHTITNNGNGSDTFDLSTTLSSDDFTFDDVEIFAAGDVGGTDLNGGTTPTIAAGGTLEIIVRASVPNTATNGQQETINITAESTFDDTETATTAVPDTAVVSEDAVVNVEKDYLDSGGNVTTGGDVGETVTVRFQFSNTGNSDAVDLTLEDVLNAGFTYVANSAIYLSTAQTDASDGDGYSYNSGTNTVNLDAGGLATGATAELTFDVTIATGTEGQTIPNTGSYNHNDINETNTNTADYTVNEDYDIAIVDNDAPIGVVVEGPANQGAVVDFVNRFENTGTASDSYEITLTDQANYPAGTTFTLFRTNGSGTVTTQINANGSGDFIIGPIAEGAEFEVVVRADLPSGVSGGGPYNLTKTLSSVNEPAETAAFTDRLTTITANVVDVTNDAAFNSSSPAPGQGVESTGEANAVQTETTDPNTTTSFSLFINNRSGVSDTYTLAASGSGDFSTALPAGWSVEFRDSGGTPLAGNSTGSIPSNGNVEVTAVVTVPSDATPGDQSVFFRAQSSSGALDVKHDEVEVNAVRSIALVTDQSDDVVPGGDVVYVHTLTNTGNVVENSSTAPAGSANPTTLQVNLAHTQASGFQSVVFLDVNNDGVIDGGDTQITGAGGTVNLPGGTLASGDTRQLLVRVSAGSGVADGTVNTTTLTVQGTGVTNVSNTDITEVVAGSLELTKTQSLTSGSGFVTTDINADPGGTVYYRIEVSNNGSASVTDVEVTDVVPAFTTMNGDVTYTPVSGPVQTTTAGSSADVTAPADGGTGTITVDVGALAQGESVTIEFAVEIDS